MKKIGLQFVKYLVTGCSAYVIDVSVFVIVRSFWGGSVVCANVAARGLGAVTAYALNHRWTFALTDVRISLSALRYASLWGLNTLISTTCLQQFTLHALSQQEYALKASIEALLILSNFVICRFWVFKKR